jgi:hypothetical protein
MENGNIFAFGSVPFCKAGSIILIEPKYFRTIYTIVPAKVFKLSVFIRENQRQTPLRALVSWW